MDITNGLACGDGSPIHFCCIPRDNSDARAGGLAAASAAGVC